MPAAFGAISFDEVDGIITPQAVPEVVPVDNPGGVPAVVLVPGQGRVDRLTYRGFFAASQAAALHATVGAVLNAQDETGATRSVLVASLSLAERPARCRGVAGHWVEASVGVIAWA